MRETLIRRLEARVQSYADLVSAMEPGDLTAKLDVPGDKSVAEHLWCVVGARESYARAVAAGAWKGFSCSVGAYGLEDFRRALASSGEALLAAIGDVCEWSAERDDLLAAVSEHEVMHEGQIIRHVYGLGRTLPASWRWA